MGQNPVADIDSLVRTANQEWFATDLSPFIDAPYTSVYIITFSLSADSEVQVSHNSGTDWTNIRTQSDSVTFVTDNLYTVPVPVRNGDDFNMRAVAAVTIDIARIDEWS